MTDGGADGPGPAAEQPPRKVLSGPTYRQLIWTLLLRRKARNYLEIGVRYGETLAKVECAAIGIDPAFAFRVEVMGKKPALHLFQMTSDAFFGSHDPQRILGEPVEVAFLDGLHLFEYLLRDFINTERACRPNSVILLDDCLPINVEMTEREHRPQLRADRKIAGWWTGDVWKVVAVLREYRPDLTITPVEVVPTGSIAVTNLDPGSTVLRDRYDEILARFGTLEFTPETFEAYWTENAPVPAKDLLYGPRFARYIDG